MSDPTARLAAQLLDLRLPLTRLSLASSQLGREPLTPACEAHCRTLQEAVEELDVRIEAMLRAIAPPAEDELVPTAALVAALAERALPLVQARGLMLEIGELQGELPASAARRAGLALLRSACGAAERGDTIALSADGRGLRARVSGSAATTDEAESRRRSLHDAVAALGARVRDGDADERFDVTVLLEGPWSVG